MMHSFPSASIVLTLVEITSTAGCVRPAQFGNLETHFNKDDFEGKQKSF
jgi:hypothetical protein